VLSAELGGGGHIDGILRFVRAVFAGEYLLIEEQITGQLPRKLILENLDRYLAYLPRDATYKIYYPPEPHHAKNWRQCSASSPPIRASRQSIGRGSRPRAFFPPRPSGVY
jgi:hypothetical protein